MTEATARENKKTAPTITGIGGVPGRDRVSLLAPLALSIVAIMIAFTIYNYLDFPEEYRWKVIAHDLCVAGVAAGIALLASRVQLNSKQEDLATLLIAVALISNILHTAHRTQDTFYIVHVVMTAVLAASFFESRRALYATWVITIAATLAVFHPMVDLRGFTDISMSLLAGIAVGVWVQEARLRMRDRLLTLRHEDDVHRAQLAIALDAVEKELADRQEAQEEREQLRDQLHHVQKMEAVGTLAGGVAHDMNNMLTVILSIASTMEQEAQRTKGESLAEDTADILAAAERGRELATNLMSFSRKGTRRLALLSAGEVIDGVVRLLARTIPKGIAIRPRVDPACSPILGSSKQLSQALMNLCINGVHAIGKEGTLIINCRELELDRNHPALVIGVEPGPFIEISVTDDGEGMPPDVAARAFEPFFTTRKGKGKEGTGLGMAMVYGTARRHGGTVTIDSKVGEGTTIRMLLPAAEGIADLPENAVITGRPEKVQKGSGTLLFVDDEQGIRNASRRVLEESGYRVLTAQDGQEALDICATDNAILDLVILDVAMPIMDGVTCLENIRRDYPGLRVLIASGDVGQEQAEQLLSQGAVGFLQKPFDGYELSDAVHRAIRRRPNTRHPIRPTTLPIE